MRGRETAPHRVSFTRPTAPVLDKSAVLDRVGGDVELLREVVVLFLNDYPKLLSDIRAASQRNEPERLEEAAHTLKGAVSNFAAEAAIQCALRLEQMGRMRDLSRAPQAIMQLEIELQRVKDELLVLDKELEP